jgi:hypothetical protein
VGRFSGNIFFRVERRSVFINKPARFGATAIVHGLLETMGRKKTVNKFAHEGGQQLQVILGSRCDDSGAFRNWVVMGCCGGLVAIFSGNIFFRVDAVGFF